MFNAFLNSPEMRAERAERERKRLATCAELLKVYGSEEAVFAETERERLLRMACEPLASWKTWIDDDGREHRYIDEADGWGTLGGKSDMPPSVREAISKAVPLPVTVSAAWAEYEASDRLTGDRYTFDHQADPALWISAREYVLEDLLEDLPAVSIADMMGRISWAESLLEHSSFRYHDEAFLKRMRADLISLAGWEGLR